MLFFSSAMQVLLSNNNLRHGRQSAFKSAASFLAISLTFLSSVFPLPEEYPTAQNYSEVSPQNNPLSVAVQSADVKSGNPALSSAPSWAAADELDTTTFLFSRAVSRETHSAISQQDSADTLDVLNLGGAPPEPIVLDGQADESDTDELEPEVNPVQENNFLIAQIGPAPAAAPVNLRQRREALRLEIDNFQHDVAALASIEVNQMLAALQPAAVQNRINTLADEVASLRGYREEVRLAAAMGDPTALAFFQEYQRLINRLDIQLVLLRNNNYIRRLILTLQRYQQWVGTMLDRLGDQIAYLASPRTEAQVTAQRLNFQNYSNYMLVSCGPAAAGLSALIQNLYDTMREEGFITP